MPATERPKARPVQYKAPLGTRWEKEKAAVPIGTFELPTDPEQIGPWLLGECVGKGASGRVKVARHCVSGQLAAVKILPLEAVLSSRLSLRARENKAEKHRTSIDKEIIMMKLMDHPNIVRLYDVFEGERELFLILEYVDGGELFDYLVNHGRMEPHKGLCYFKQIIYGLAYAHAFSVIHRDLKPENILIASLNPPHVKIADWGMAAFAPPEHHLETSCGSPHYASPEIVRGEPYSGTATDIWSCGVILFALMTGRLPFDDKNIRNLLQKVKSGKYEVPSYVFPEAADLIRRMLVVDVDKRITMPEILAHPFLAHSISGIKYVAAPSISELDRPLRSRALVQQDLLSSLLLICPDSSYDEVVNELLSPSGQGSLIKALYYLLARHRERTLEEYGMQSVFYNDGYNIKHYAAPPLKRNSASEPGIGSTSRTRPQSGQSRTKSHTSDLTQTHLKIATPSIEGVRSLSVKQSRPPSPAGPRMPGTPHFVHYKSRPASSPPVSRDARTEHGELENDRALSRVPSLEPNMVRRRSRRTQTVDGLPFNQQQYDRLTVPIPSPELIHPCSPHLLHENENKLTESCEMVLPTMAPDTSSALPPLDLGAATPWLEKPKVENPVLQRTIDDIERKFGIVLTKSLAANPNSDSGNAPVGLGFTDTLAEATHEQSKRERERGSCVPRTYKSCFSDSKAQFVEPGFRYSLPNKKTMNLLLQPTLIDGVTDKHDKENLDILNISISAERESKTRRGRENRRSFLMMMGVPESSSLNAVSSGAVEEYATEDDSYMKIEKREVEQELSKTTNACIAVVEQRRTSRGRRDTDTMSQSGPLSGSFKDQSLQPSSHGSDAGVSSARGGPSSHSAPLLAAPAVVGEVKGWFANLFNWKAQQYVLHSVDGCAATREEAIRLLQNFGCQVVPNEQGWGVLRCRRDEVYDLRSGMVTMKSVRFRVEFSPIVGYTSMPSHGHSHGLGISSKRSSATPSSSSATGDTSAGVKQLAPFMSMVVLIQEKGALSTFKYVHQRLRREWGGSDALCSPDLNSALVPIVGTTPKIR